MVQEGTDIKEIQEKIEDLLSGLVGETRTQIEDLNKQNSELAVQCHGFQEEARKSALAIRKLEEKNAQLIEANQALTKEVKAAKKNFFDLRQKMLAVFNGLEATSSNNHVAEASTKLKFVLVSDDGEVKRARNMLDNLEEKFPNIIWELLGVPSAQKSLQFVDLIIYCRQLIKNRKHTSWINHEAKKHGITIIRPQGSGVQIQEEVLEFLDKLKK